MNRRGFMKSILAAGIAPYVISSGVLMPVKQRIWTPQRKIISMEFGPDLRNDRVWKIESIDMREGIKSVNAIT